MVTQKKQTQKQDFLTAFVFYFKIHNSNIDIDLYNCGMDV